MLKKFFLAPGRLLLNVFSGGKRRNYRSTRSRATVGLGAIILSGVCWLVIAGGLLYAVDKAGLLKRALDAGVEAAGVNEPNIGSGSTPAEPSTGAAQPEPETDSATARGSLASGAGNQAQQGASSGADASAAAEKLKQPEAAKAWLVILRSLPKKSRDEAERWQRQYKKNGLEVDIFDSDAFPLLKRDYWIVALGPFDDKASAAEAATKAAKFTTDLMIRQGI